MLPSHYFTPEEAVSAVLRLTKIQGFGSQNGFNVQSWLHSFRTIVGKIAPRLKALAQRSTVGKSCSIQSRYQMTRTIPAKSWPQPQPSVPFSQLSLGLARMDFLLSRDSPSFCLSLDALVIPRSDPLEFLEDVYYSQRLVAAWSQPVKSPDHTINNLSIYPQPSTVKHVAFISVGEENPENTYGGKVWILSGPFLIGSGLLGFMECFCTGSRLMCISDWPLFKPFRKNKVGMRACKYFS